MKKFSVELYHHGIKGQKWGVRRYQNEDGTLTAAGRRHFSQISDNSKKVEFDERGRIAGDEKNRGNARTAIHETVANDYKTANSALNATASATRSASNIARNSGNRKRQKEMSKMDVSQMSDKDLQQAINRMNLERTYKSMSTENVSRGADYTSSVLSTVGDIVTIGASVASIAVAIHQLKG